MGLLAAGLGALLLLFLALNAFNLSFLFPRSSAQLFLFTGLSVLVFLVLLFLLVLLFRNILKLYGERTVLGSRIRTRMLVGALLLSFAPAFFPVSIQLPSDEPHHRPLVFAASLAAAG